MKVNFSLQEEGEGAKTFLLGWVAPESLGVADSFFLELATARDLCPLFPWPRLMRASSVIT